MKILIGIHKKESCMKKLMMGACLVVLFAGAANVFADIPFATFNKWVQVIRLDKPMDQKNLSLIELCHLKRYTEGTKQGLDNYIRNLSSGVKKDLLSEFRSLIDTLIKTKDDYLGGLKGELIVRIKAINANASCLK